MTKNVMAAIAVLGLTVGMSAGVHATELIINGGFEDTTSGAGQMGYNTDATGWTTSGYNFIFTSGSADTTGVPGQYGNLELWGPGNGSNNGLPASSPAGGNYVGADGAFQVGAISQTINGLTPGQYYAVSFDWAGAQQSGFNGVTTEDWLVSLGSDTESTPILTDPNNGFTGWQQQTLGFTADSSSEVLSFLAQGTPDGEPPFSLLDNVSMVATPEPSPLVAMFVGALVLGAISFRRFRTKKSIA